MRFAPAVTSPAAVLLFALAFAAPAHAQQNKQIISGTWYEDRAFGFGNPNSDLLMTFTQTPANKFLNITLVSCSITSYNNQLLADVILQAGTQSGSTDTLRPQSVRGAASTQTGIYNYYSVVTQTYYKVGPGRFPGLEIQAPSSSPSNTNAFISAHCTIVGTLSDN